MLDKILNRRNIERALKAVERNKGVGGVDGLQSDELRQFLNASLQCLVDKIKSGIYEPSPVRKVEIPKPSGGKRMLGIPTVVDRMIQQAIYQVLNPIYEKEFSENSYGFRPGRNAHQAVKAAQGYVNAGYTRIIELDLEKFFDKVNHQKLMSLLSEQVKDKPTLKLINSYLKSGIMEGGVISARTEGTPQGSPLSPLLSNIMLNELDKELKRRGHKFVRYADDASIYVKSERAGTRVKESITSYLEEKLLLKVNQEKTQVSRPQKSYLLGFSFYKCDHKQGYQLRIHAKPIERIKEKCKEITRSSAPLSERLRLLKLDEIIRGWVNYFKIANAKEVMRTLDERIRTRLRINAWRRWKNIGTKIKKLTQLGIGRRNAYMWGNSSKGACRIAHSPILKRTLDTVYLRKQGYVGFSHYYNVWQIDQGLMF